MFLVLMMRGVILWGPVQYWGARDPSCSG